MILLLHKVNAAEHKPSERERSSQNPIPYVSLILHDRVPDLMPEDCSEDRSSKAPAVYSTFAKATAAVLALF
ncbi:hypothetical protein NUU61_001984 [Penicillium alfredii]|uniref:Uncharacterized protein n=1 Tax=Penicillium alfredii TaxID=1506179 RepID=A0A9W9FQT3_9EURO|nr:uncharacterized protein NUU61_001984 [Penicillium alfredii]KAJ5104637.1 hypothetical protein NUU61_001984 [Penicillium alfredii]